MNKTKRAQVSLNNGGTFYTAKAIDEQLLQAAWPQLCEAMDADICENLHGTVTDEREFLRMYLDLASDDLVIG